MRTDHNHPLAADPLFQRARNHGVRTLPLVRSPDLPLVPVLWWPLLKVFAAGSFGAAALFGVCALIWGG